MTCHKSDGRPCRCCREMSAKVDKLADRLAGIHKLVLEFVAEAAGNSEWGAAQLRALLSTPRNYRRFRKILPHIAVPPLDDVIDIGGSDNQVEE